MEYGGLRGMMRVLAHRPFQEEIAQRFLWLLGLPSDGVLEKANQGVHSHFVRQAQGDALAYLGSDRGVVHGLTESDASYAGRVARALDDWHVAGSAWSVLGQVLGYVLSAQPRALAISSVYTAAGVLDSTQWDFFTAGADTAHPPTHLLNGAGNWDWDSASPQDGSWSPLRWYLVLGATAPNAWINLKGKVGSTGLKVGARGKAVGVDAVADVGRSIKVIVDQWRPVGVWSHWIMIAFNDALFLPTASAGGGVNPGGTFGRWAKLSGDAFVSARYAGVCYFTGPV